VSVDPYKTRNETVLLVVLAFQRNELVPVPHSIEAGDNIDRTLVRRASMFAPRMSYEVSNKSNLSATPHGWASGASEMCVSLPL
jgi:hypothetical protein